MPTLSFAADIRPLFRPSDVGTALRCDVILEDPSRQILNVLLFFAE